MSSGGLGRQIATMVSGKTIIRLSQFVAFIFLARALSPAQFGWYGIITSSVALAAMLGTLGLRQSFAREIGQERLTPGKAVGTALALLPFMTLATTAVILFIYGSDLAELLGGPAHWVVAALMLGSLMLMLLQGIFLGKGEIGRFTITESMPRLLLLVGAVSLGLLGILRLPSALWLQASTFLLPMPLVAYWCLKNGGRIKTAFRQLPQLVRFGIVVALNLFMITFCARISMFIIERLVDAEAAGQFFAAIRVTEIFLDIATAIGLVLFSRTTRSKDIKRSLRESLNISAWMFWGFALLSAPIALLAPLLLTLAIGSDYADAAPALQILAISLAPAASRKMVYPALAGAGRPGLGTPVLIAGLVITAVAAILLVPYYGINGGAIAFVIGQFVLLLGYMITCQVALHIPLFAMIVPRRPS